MKTLVFEIVKHMKIQISLCFYLILILKTENQKTIVLQCHLFASKSRLKEGLLPNLDY